MPDMIIVESPVKARKFQELLGDGYIVAASVGHIDDLPTRGDIGFTRPDYHCRYEMNERGQSVVAKLKQAAGRAGTVYLATDPDREGEAIAWRLAERLALRAPKRITYQAVSEAAIRESLSKPRQIDRNLVDAQIARRILDRMFGWEVTRAISDEGHEFMTAGRVQSAVLRLIVERDAEITRFRPTGHYRAALAFDGWKAQWRTEKHHAGPETPYVLDRAVAEKAAAVRRCRVTAYAEPVEHEHPPAPFSTPDFLKSCFRELKLDAAVAADYAQRLFQLGMISYHRTDSKNLDAASIEAQRAYAAAQGWPVHGKIRTWKNPEGAQEGHEAIRPIYWEKAELGEGDRSEITKLKLDPDVANRIYQLVRVRALASQLAPAEFAAVRATLDSEDGQFSYRASGRRLTAPGWKAYYRNEEAIGEEEDGGEEAEVDAGAIPPMRVGDVVIAGSGVVEQATTRPPGRFSQASMIEKLEKIGLGRPSTIAGLLPKLVQREYVVTNRKRLLESTDKGRRSIALLINRFEIAEVAYTAGLEKQLDEIAGGRRGVIDVVRPADEHLQAEIMRIVRSLVVEGTACDGCGAPLRSAVRRDSKGGSFTLFECTGCQTRYSAGLAGQPLMRSSFACETCGGPMRHAEGKWDDGREYRGFRCETRDCRTFWREEGGRPVAPRARPLSEHKCARCEAGLFALKGVSSKTGKPYSFFACSNAKCEARYDERDGAPVLPERFCPACRAPLRKVSGSKDGRDYLFFACDAEKCGKRFNVVDDELKAWEQKKKPASTAKRKASR